MASRPVAEAIELEPELQEAEPTNYALRLTEALDAIAAAQPGAAVPEANPISVRAAAETPAPAFAEVLAAAQVQLPADAEIDGDAAAEDLTPAALAAKPNRVAAFLEALDKLPPIKLPIGPAIPWRVGLPMLVAICAVMLFMSRPSSSTATADQPGVKLPSQETYAVQQQSPLFAKPTPEADPAMAAQAQAQPLGVKEPAATASVDVLDMLVKFIAVLAVMGGSLYALKRFGPGGSSLAKGDPSSGVRVVSSVVLAPNRTVHVLRTPDGKSLLLGATPNQVNLIADLGELSEDALTAQGSSFFDVLATKLAKAA